MIELETHHHYLARRIAICHLKIEVKPLFYLAKNNHLSLEMATKSAAPPPARGIIPCNSDLWEEDGRSGGRRKLITRAADSDRPDRQAGGQKFRLP